MEFYQRGGALRRHFPLVVECKRNEASTACFLQRWGLLGLAGIWAPCVCPSWMLGRRWCSQLSPRAGTGQRIQRPHPNERGKRARRFAPASPARSLVLFGAWGQKRPMVNTELLSHLPWIAAIRRWIIHQACFWSTDSFLLSLLPDFLPSIPLFWYQGGATVCMRLLSWIYSAYE